MSNTLKIHQSNKKSNNNLLQISLMCSLLALGAGDLLLQNNLQQKIKNQTLYQTYQFQSINCIRKYLSSTQSSKALRETIVKMLKTLDSSPTVDRINLHEVKGGGIRIRQYLRKFTFFYKSFINIYPNDLGNFSSKDSNMLAIKCLYLLTSL